MVEQARAGAQKDIDRNVEELGQIRGIAGTPFEQRAKAEIAQRARGQISQLGPNLATQLIGQGTGFALGTAGPGIQGLSSAAQQAAQDQALAAQRSSQAGAGAGALLGSVIIAAAACDVDLKESFDAVDPQDMLDKLDCISIESWKYKGDEGRHIGPMAQEFAEVFGLGDDEKKIAFIDLVGVSMAAIQGLRQENRELRDRLAALEGRLQ